MKDFYIKNKTLVDKAIFIVFLIFGSYLFFNNVFNYVSPFIFGYILSVILNPLVNLITKYTKVKRGLASVFSIALLFVAIALIFTNIIVRIIQEGQAFFNNLPVIAVYVEQVGEELYTKFADFYKLIPIELREIFSGLSKSLINLATNFAGSVVKVGSTKFVVKIPNFILNLVLGVVSSFFFLKDKYIISSSLKNLVPTYFTKNLKIIKDGILKAIAGYLKSQGIMMSIIGIINVSGLFIIRAPYALFLGILIAIVDAFPVFGSGFFYWPWIAFTLITQDYKMSIGLGIIYITNLLTRQILEPRILADQIGIHPLLTLMSIYTGMQIFGVLGIVIGPCIVVTIKAIVEAPVETARV